MANAAHELAGRRAVRARARGDSNIAALLTWFLPGAGHLYLGMPVVAVASFVVLGATYALGLYLSDGMTFQYLEPELRTPFAPALSPEMGNLGGFIWQVQQYGYGQGEVRAWPELMRLGSSLCALSGVGNMLLMVKVHFDARGEIEVPAEEIVSPPRAVALAWLVPGLGHWMQGRRQRAALVFTVLVGLFVAGSILAEGSNLSRERHFYYWAGQFMLGLPALLAEVALGSKRVIDAIPLGDAGLVFGCVAGLLNVLAMIDVFGYSEAKVFGLPPKSSAEAVEETAP